MFCIVGSVSCWNTCFSNKFHAQSDIESGEEGGQNIFIADKSGEDSKLFLSFMMALGVRHPLSRFHIMRYHNWKAAKLLLVLV